MLAAGRVDVEVDVLLRVLAVEVEDLGDDQVRHLLVDGAAEEDDALAKQQRIDVECSLPASARFDDRRDDHAARSSHWGAPATTGAGPSMRAYVRCCLRDCGAACVVRRRAAIAACGADSDCGSPAGSPSQLAASRRLLTPSFVRISDTWNFAPSRLMPSSRPISPFDRPSRTSSSTSHWRGVRTSG